MRQKRKYSIFAIFNGFLKELHISFISYFCAGINFPLKALSAFLQKVWLKLSENRVP